MILTNKQIYFTVQAFNEAFKDFDKYLPVKINFYISKNITLLNEATMEIEQNRLNIIRNYSEEKEDGFFVPPDKIDAANKELSDLLEIEQDLPIKILKIEDIPEDISLTPAQMSALMFMIEE